jgi:hypothetical protein
LRLVTRRDAREVAVTLGRASVVIGLCTIPAADAAAAQRNDAAPSSCTPSAALTRVAELPEGSGAAASRSAPGRIWVHNDSGKPILMALDESGAVAGRVAIAGIEIEDWEAIAVGPCGSNGSCLYIADIGDNDGSRERISVHRVPEPAKPAGSLEIAESFHASYPEGPQDAEALLVAPDGAMYVVTKGETGPVALYRFPKDAKPGATVRLERVAQGSPTSAKAQRVTDGSISPDGEWVALRTNGAVSFYRASEFVAGKWKETKRVDLTPLKEPQGEGVALAAGNVIYLVGEGGGKGQGGTFARFVCAPGA